MWFCFGLLSLLGAAVCFTKRNIANNWTGVAAAAAGTVYWTDIKRGKVGIRSIKVGVACDTGVSFCLKPETELDSTFKRLGLSQEQQLDQLKFDENIYVISDDLRLGDLLKANPGLAGQLQSLFETRKLPTFLVKKLWCQRGRLWVEAAPFSSPNEQDVTAFAVELIPQLRPLADALSKNVAVQGGSQDYFIVKAAVLGGISSALAINGAIQLFRLIVTRFPHVIDNGQLLRDALLLSTVAIVALLGLCIVWLGRTSRAHLVLLELLFIGSFGAFASSYMVLRDFNVEFDSAPAQHFTTAIRGRRMQSCGRSSRRHCYTLELAPWSGQNNPLTLEVDAESYNRYLRRTEAAIVQHEGALHRRWIEQP